MLSVPRHKMMLILVFLGVLALIQNAWYWNQLPDRVAIHFGANGQPNSWLDKSGATLLMLGVQIGLPWLLVGIARMTRVLPPSLINIPHSEFWLAPERREVSLSYLENFIVVIGITASLFMMAMNHLSFVANMRGQSLNLQAMALLGALYLTSIAVLVIGMWRRFRLPKAIA